MGTRRLILKKIDVTSVIQGSLYSGCTYIVFFSRSVVGGLILRSQDAGFDSRLVLGSQDTGFDSRLGHSAQEYLMCRDNTL